MKKIISVFLVCFFITALMQNANAQVMAQKAQWITIKSNNLKCWECKQRLEAYMMKESDASYEGGIAQLKFNLLQGELKVQFYPDRIDTSDIKLIINNAGFDADTEKANPDSYKKLPAICKRAEDGGGPKKGEPCHVEP